jgi:hypothetical protein
MVELKQERNALLAQTNEKFIAIIFKHSFRTSQKTLRPLGFEAVSAVYRDVAQSNPVEVL